MRKLLILLAISLAGCAATISMEEHNMKMLKLRNTLSPTQEQLAYEAQAQTEATELESFLKHWTTEFVAALNATGKLGLKVKIHEFSFVNDFKAAIAYVTIFNSTGKLGGYATFARVDGKWIFTDLTYTERSISRSPPRTNGIQL